EEPPEREKPHPQNQSQSTEDEQEPEPDALSDWKEALRRDFERWLATMEEIPAEENEPPGEVEDPDLYSFYEQLAVTTSESRKGNRRTAEALSQWGEILGRFDGDI